MLSILWPSRIKQPLTLPRYLSGNEEDSIDLQVASLRYMFKRLDIPNASPFMKQTPHGYELSLDPSQENDRLDLVYNLKQFRRLLLQDEHRILVDYVKNRFRSLMILSEMPQELTSLDEKKQFSFSVLSPNSSIDVYIKVLVHSSGMYREHNVAVQERIQMATTAIGRQKKSVKSFDKNDRAVVIKTYLDMLGFQVQCMRIYRASLRTQQRITMPTVSESLVSGSSFSSVSRSPNARSPNARSPDSRAPTSPISKPSAPVCVPTSPQRRPLRSAKSRSDIRSNFAPNIDMRPPDRSRTSSPEKRVDRKPLAKKPSLSNLKFENLYKPESTNEDLGFEKCRTAVKARLEKERHKILGETL